MSTVASCDGVTYSLIKRFCSSITAAPAGWVVPPSASSDEEGPDKNSKMLYMVALAAGGILLLALLTFGIRRYVRWKETRSSTMTEFQAMLHRHGIQRLSVVIAIDFTTSNSTGDDEITGPGDLHTLKSDITNPYEYAVSVAMDALDALTQSVDAFMFGVRNVGNFQLVTKYGSSFCHRSYAPRLIFCCR